MIGVAKSWNENKNFPKRLRIIWYLRLTVFLNASIRENIQLIIEVTEDWDEKQNFIKGHT